MSLRSFFASAGRCKNLISRVVSAFVGAASSDISRSTSAFRPADGNQRVTKTSRRTSQSWSKLVYFAVQDDWTKIRLKSTWRDLSATSEPRKPSFWQATLNINFTAVDDLFTSTPTPTEKDIATTTIASRSSPVLAGVGL